MGGLERRCGFSLCAVSSLTSRRLNLRRVRLKDNKGKSLRRQGDKSLSRYLNWRIHQVSTAYILSNVAKSRSSGVPNIQKSVQGNVKFGET